MLLLSSFRLHSVILSMESILFGLFVLAIMWDQMQAILTDETAVEQVITVDLFTFQ